MNDQNFKKTIVLDFDDTLVRSSEQIIKMLNEKYGLDKSIEDLSDWSYRNIYHNITEKELSDLFASGNFFAGVKYNEGVIPFLNYAQDKYKIVICSKGTPNNLYYKELFCTAMFAALELDGEFIGIEIGDVFDSTLDKSKIDFSECLFAVDDNTNALMSMNVPCKILLKNYHEQYWNKTPINEPNLYVINDFYELINICKFDEQLREAGVELGAR